MTTSSDAIVRLDTLCASLTAAGLVPAGADLAPLATALRQDIDLLSPLVQIWSDAGATAGQRSRDATLDWLGTQLADGAKLTLGADPARRTAVDRWLGVRLAWWPAGIPSGRRVGLASSRLGRQLDSQEAWFALLRAACAKVDPQNDLLLTSEATTAAPFVRRAAQLFGLRLLTIETPSHDDMPLRRWFEQLRETTSATTSAIAARVLLSPPLLDDDPQADREIAQSAPVRDRALLAISDRLLAFHVRRRGQLLALLRRRLADIAWPSATVYLALGRRLVSPSVAAELMDLGAVGWVVPAASRAAASAANPPADDARASSQAAISGRRIVPVPPDEPWEFLTHWTRRQDGPWPDQTEEEYLAELILQSGEADHSALSALRRIVAQRRLLASRQGIRGGTPVVSLTAVPLADLHGLRVFRPHRGRWDFEPYGICIRRTWLERQGARPVQYGNDALWEALSQQDRPFFQVQTSRGSAARREIIDWSVEQEWRHAGTIDLQQLPPQDGLVFVPSVKEARQLAQISRWPITIVNAPERME